MVETAEILHRCPAPPQESTRNHMGNYVFECAGHDWTHCSGRRLCLLQKVLACKSLPNIWNVKRRQTRINPKRFWCTPSGIPNGGSFFFYYYSEVDRIKKIFGQSSGEFFLRGPFEWEAKICKFLSKRGFGSVFFKCSKANDSLVFATWLVNWRCCGVVLFVVYVVVWYYL